MKRIEEVRDNPKFLYTVRKVILFGSCLDLSERINDIDIAIELKPKEKDMQKLQEQNMDKDREMQRLGKKFRNIPEKIYWSETEFQIIFKRTFTEFKYT